MLKFEKEIVETIRRADIEAHKDYHYISREIELQKMIVQLATKNQELLEEKMDSIQHYKTKLDIVYNYLCPDLEENEETMSEQDDMSSM